jgi:hypothetical protein
MIACSNPAVVLAARSQAKSNDPKEATVFLTRMAPQPGNATSVIHFFNRSICPAS